LKDYKATCFHKRAPRLLCVTHLENADCKKIKALG
jgi:hypothetical protein